MYCSHAYSSPAFSSTASDVAFVVSEVTSGGDTASGVSSGGGGGSMAASCGGMASGGARVSTEGDR